MTTASYLLLAIAAIFAVLDWIAVGRDSAVLEYVAKPTATAAVLGMTASFGVTHDAQWGWRLAAFALCILGDVFLMLPRDAFIPGLASFAVAQVMFTVSFAVGETHTTRFVIGLVIAIVIAVVLARRFVGAMRREGHRDLIAPVVVYLVVIAAMLIGAISGGSIIAIIGAVVFMVSDSLIAESRFVKARTWHPVGIMITYHVALFGLALGLL